MIQFLPCNEARDQFPHYDLPSESMFVGLMDADAICLLPDGSLVVYDHGVSNRVLCKAAPSQETFLEAVAVLENHFKACVEDPRYWAGESAAREVSRRCTEIAGGEDYASFFCTMIGA